MTVPALKRGRSHQAIASGGGSSSIRAETATFRLLSRFQPDLFSQRCFQIVVTIQFRPRQAPKCKLAD